MVIVIQGMCILSQTYHSKCNYSKLILTSELYLWYVLFKACVSYLKLIIVSVIMANLF